MTLLATLLIALRALRANPLRSALTMLGIVIGVAAVIAMLAIGAGAQSRIEQQIRALGSNLIVVTPGSVIRDGLRQSAGTAFQLTEDDAQAIQTEIDTVQVAAPSMRRGGQVIALGSNWPTQLHGVTPEFFEAREWQIVEGRAIDGADVQSSARVAVIGQTVARELFAGVDPIGETLRVGRVPVTVIGVLGPKGENAFGADQDDLVMLPLSMSRSQVFGADQGRLRRVGSISVRVHDGQDLQQAVVAIESLLRQRYRLGPEDEAPFRIRNLSEILSAQEASSRVFTILLAAVASVSLLVGGIGIMNILLVSVTERTREIGLRMAVGARPRDIRAQFLAEALMLCSLGAVLGVALGAGAAALVAQLAQWPVQIEAAAVGLAVGAALAIGLFFGWYPAQRAARLQPVAALRFE